MNKKGIKTTITAFIFLALLIGLIIAMILDEVTFDELKNVLTVSTPVFILLIGWFAKDANQSHTK